MQRIQGQNHEYTQIATKVLTWVVYAKRLLKVEELQHALAVHEGDSEVDFDNFLSFEDLTSFCAELVTIDQEGKVIRLVHYTAQEFFKRKKRDFFPEAEQQLAATCLAYIRLQSLDTTYQSYTSSFEERPDQHNFYQYAVKHWGDHMRPVQTAMLPAVYGFFDDQPHMQYAASCHLAPHIAPSTHGVHWCAWFNLTEICMHFLNLVEAADQKAGDLTTPLGLAASRGHAEIVQMLMDRGDIDINANTLLYGTPLMNVLKVGMQRLCVCFCGGRSLI